MDLDLVAGKPSNPRQSHPHIGIRGRMSLGGTLTERSASTCANGGVGRGTFSSVHGEHDEVDQKDNE